MSRQINQPINQVRLTNVATVRMQKGGKRFEIACYRNKVVNYRQGLETDLSEVLQTERVFTNVSKGQFAKSKDLRQVFGTDNEEEVVKIILEKGTLQVSDLERSQQYENTLREVATWVANNCVHPISQRPYTVPQIRHAMKQAEFAVHPTKSVKRQYLDCVKLLQQKDILPIQRAKMKLSLTYPVELTSSVQETLKELEVTPVETTESDGQVCVGVLVDPSLYRDLDTLEDCRLEILQQVVRQEGDVDLDVEMERKKRQSVVAEEHQQDTLADEMENKLHVTNDVDAKNGGEMVQEAAVSTDDQYGTQDGNSMRQNQKKANKKSKKAKRREKEEAADRQARIDAEKQRQEERAKAMGGEQHPTTNDSGNQQQPQGETKSCNTCGGSFPSASAYRAHFRSDWHRYNMQLKMKGVAPVSEQEFLAVDSDAFFDGI